MYVYFYMYTYVCVYFLFVHEKVCISYLHIILLVCIICVYVWSIYMHALFYVVCVSIVGIPKSVYPLHVHMK